MLQRGGEVVIRMLENVQQATIAPLLRATIEPGAQVYTDEYDIYHRLTDWGYLHSTVCHSHGEYARDEDGDRFHEVHVNTIEGFWRPPRGPCCAPGCGPIEGFPRRSCRCTWASSSSCTTPGFAAKGFSSPSWDFFWRS
jgi:hypothetical protein